MANEHCRRKAGADLREIAVGRDWEAAARASVQSPGRAIKRKANIHASGAAPTERTSDKERKERGKKIESMSIHSANFFLPLSNTWSIAPTIIRGIVSLS